MRVTSFWIGLVALAASLFGFCPEADACTGNCANYLYINGVSIAAYRDRGASAHALQLRLSTTGNYLSSGAVVALENPSQGLIADVLKKLVVQKEIEYNLTFGQSLSAVVATMVGDSTLSSNAPQYITMGDIQSAMASIYQGALTDTQNNVVSPTLLEDYGTIVATMQKGLPVILVAHSEGNMYANELYAELKASTVTQNAQFPFTFDFTSYLKVVNIANPAAQAPSGFYGTAQQDKVIGGLALLMRGMPTAPMPANWTYAAPSWDFWYGIPYPALDHSFVGTYMNPKRDTLNAFPALMQSQVDPALQGHVPVMDIVYAEGLPGVVELIAPDGSITNPGNNGGNIPVTAATIQDGTYTLGIQMANASYLGNVSSQYAFTVASLAADAQSQSFASEGYVPLDAIPQGQFIPMASIIVTQTSPGAPYDVQTTFAR